MKCLTPLQVIAIHDQVIKHFGGSHGIRDLSLVESAVARPQVTFDGHDMYETLFEKAAALLHSLLQKHAFVDGNKRIAYSSTAIFLAKNNYELKNLHTKAVEFMVQVEAKNLQVERISKWLEKYSKRI